MLYIIFIQSFLQMIAFSDAFNYLSGQVSTTSVGQGSTVGGKTLGFAGPSFQILSPAQTFWSLKIVSPLLHIFPQKEAEMARNTPFSCIISQPLFSKLR